ncbi:MAG: DUF6067 family protein [Marinilabilia sp.]
MYKTIILSVFTVFLFYSCQEKIEGTGFDEPANPQQADPKDWEGVEPGFHVAFGSIDERYAHHLPPPHKPSFNWEKTAWKGERKNLQLMLWSSETVESIEVKDFLLKGPDGAIIASENIGIHPVRYVLTDAFLSGCGWRDKDTIQSSLAADLLEYNQAFNLETQTLRPVWITIDVPANVSAGTYQGKIKISRWGGRSKKLPLTLKVRDLNLPSPDEWGFHLDLWQNPFAVARFHETEMWSQQHMDALTPYLEKLAGAGQKCITTSILHKPWGGQTYDQYESMIKWIYLGNDEWEYDYSVFDQWVQLAMDAGINEQINCYSMVPWGNQVQYYDKDSLDFVTIEVKPGSKEYTELWEPFLIHFRNHLREKGWLERATIAIDERELDEMQAMITLIKRVAPEFKIAMAGEYHEEVSSEIKDLCVFHVPDLEEEIIKERDEEGLNTTFYTMCAKPEHPNNFTFSPPAEQALLGWYAAAKGFDGYLRWAYNSWVEDPLKDSRFRTWPAGDTYQIYPGPRSSIRFERLREGIQDYEKIKVVRSMLKTRNDTLALNKMDSMLSIFSHENITQPKAAYFLNQGKNQFNQIINEFVKNK